MDAATLTFHRSAPPRQLSTERVSAMLGDVEPMEVDPRSPWERRVDALPYPLLAVSVLAAILTANRFGADTPALIIAQIALVAAAAGWTWWGKRRLSDAGPRTGAGSVVAMLDPRIHFVARTALAFALTLLNPVYAIYAVLGFFDLAQAFRGSGQWFATLAVSIMVAGACVGGLPPASPWQWLAFALLTVLDTAVVLLILSVQRELQIRTREQAGTITELERVNGELEASLTQIETLQATIRDQARHAGIEEERRRLAREIHDTIAQSLAGALAQLRAAETDPDPRPRLARATALTRGALSDARRSVKNLAPSELTGTVLRTALEAHVASWNQDQGATAELHVIGEERPVHREVEATVLRITQEALTNVARHAQASRVDITLTYDESDLILDVRDDGVGFDPETAPGPSSFGLRSMAQRAERLLGRLDIESEPSTGTGTGTDTRSGTALSIHLPALDPGERP